MKTFEVKVYDLNGTYLATWNDIVSDINFNNELNSAGGQLQIKLARDAGDFGEGTDVDFGHKVMVYCFDKDAPEGTIIFQGYISSYTPVYSDNTIDIIVLGYGSELNDYIIEAGEALDQSQLVQTTNYSGGNSGSLYNTVDMAQSITAVGSGKWSKVDLNLATSTYYNSATGVTTQRTNVGVYLEVYSGLLSGTTTLLGTSNIIYIADGTYADYSFTFVPTIPYTNGSSYTFILKCVSYANGSDQYMYNIKVGSGYTGGSRWYSFVS